MSVRKEIRDRRSDHNTRVFDYVREDDGTERIEVKSGNCRRSILLSDMEEQINEAKTS